MSGGIQLSDDLVNDLKEVALKYDKEANDDIVFVQYMSAVAAFVLAHQTNPGLDKRSVLQEVGNFMQHVLQQVESDIAPQQPAEDAFGVWKPGDK